MRIRGMRTLKGIAMKNVKTLQSSAMLLDLSMSVFSGVKTDRSASEGFNQISGAKTRSSRVVKNIFAGDDSLRDIAKVTADVRAYLRTITLPWSDHGVRLVPTKNFFEITEYLSKSESLFWRLVEEFIDEYPSKIQVAKENLGTLFNANDYPTEIEVRKRFSFSYRFEPVPNAQDFRVDLQNEALEYLKENLNKGVQGKMGQAVEDLHGRVVEAAQTLKNWCREVKEGEHKPRTHSVTYERIQELVKSLDSLNIFGDELIEESRKALESTIGGIDIEDIRESEDIRAVIREDVQNILDKFSV